MKLLLTRHGQSRWQVEGDSAGPNAPLTALGRLQAHRLGAYLQHHEQIERIVASSLLRAQQTATIIATYLALPVFTDPDLREYDDWEAGYAPRPTSPWDLTPAEEQAEVYCAFRARVVGAVQRALAAENGSDPTVLIVAHGGTLGTLLRHLFGAATLRLWTSNTGLHALDWNGEFWSAHYLNWQEHLPFYLRSS